MQILEGLKYATTLYLNKGYLRIEISPQIKYMTKILMFGIFRHNWLPMGI